MSKRPHFIASLVSALSLLLASGSAQAGSFFSFHFSFDNYDGYYHPYRYVYEPSYLYSWPYYDWPYFYGYSHYYPVTYIYYPSVFYRPIFPYSYPYYAYHPHWHRHHHWAHHYRYNDYRYSYHRPYSSTQVYGYYQPRKSYYQKPHKYYKGKQNYPAYTKNNYRHDNQRYDQPRYGESNRQVNNQLASARLEERFRRERETERFQAQHNEQPRQRPYDSRQPDIRRTEQDTRQFTFNGPQNTSERPDMNRDRRDLRQPGQERETSVRAEPRQSRRIYGQEREAARTQREERRESGINRGRNLATNDYDASERFQSRAAQREDRRERNDAGPASGKAERSENRSTRSARSSMSNRNTLAQRDSFRGNSEMRGSRNR